MVSLPFKRNYRVRFGGGSRPCFSVYSRRTLALIFSHSSYGNCFAIDRAGQQPLQGSHLVPAVFLNGLHDTGLHSFNVAMCLGPIDAVPRYAHVGRCTCQLPIHLLSCLQRLHKLSRDEKPVGSLPAFASDDFGCPTSVSPPLQRGLCFLQPPLPAHPTAFLAVSLPSGQMVGLTLFRCLNRMARFLHYAGDFRCLRVL